MKKLIALGLVTALVGCGQGGSSSGVEEAGTGPSKTAKVVHRPHDTPESSRSHKWATSNIAINVNTAWSRAAAETWRVAGVSFRHGAGGGITFKGYSTARNSVGWAQYHRRSNGIIYRCDIFVNPRYLQKYDIEKTMAHEIGHCLGISGHMAGNGLMSKFARRRAPSQQTINLVRHKYGRKPPVVNAANPRIKSESNGKVRLVSDR